MSCRPCTGLSAAYLRLDLRVERAAAPGPTCVVSVPHALNAYSNTADLRAIKCVRGDDRFYYSRPIGEIVLGDDMVG